MAVDQIHNSKAISCKLKPFTIHHWSLYSTCGPVTT